MQGPPAPPPLIVSAINPQKVDTFGVFITGLPPNAGRGDVPKGTLLGLDKGMNYFLYILFGWQCVEKCDV